MTIWAIADTHLAFGNSDKSMEVFGPPWKDYPKKIKANWEEIVGADDLTLIAGDISWAIKPDAALADLEFIDALPGEKLIIRGNHDYWWPSNAKLKRLLPPSIHFIHNTAFHWNGVAFGGARLWESREYEFSKLVQFIENPHQCPPSAEKEAEQIFTRELGRLKLSLERMDPHAKIRITLTHYPPISYDLKPSRAASILEDHEIDVCVFGHLHNLRDGTPLFGEARGVKYVLTSADYLGFSPIKILD